MQEAADQASNGKELVEKLGVFFLSSIFGAGTYTVAKNLLNKRRQKEKELKEEEAKKIKEQIFQNLSGI